MTNWHETQSSTQVFDKLYHHLIGSLLEFQLVPPQFLVRLEKVMMILYPDIVRQIAENEGDMGVDGVPCIQPPLGVYQDHLTDTEMYQFVIDLRNVIFILLSQNHVEQKTNEDLAREVEMLREDL
jgi:hypothetical protein